ncbi:hypothetical protein VCSRO146_3584 [Vibrio cholerae]|nr:hypothetical protein VCSRO146_3584 [Vibrio cholerae]
MPQSDYSQEQYQADFLDNKCVTRQALDRALDTRKFEIELYCAYFGAFRSVISGLSDHPFPLFFKQVVVFFTI